MSGLSVFRTVQVMLQGLRIFREVVATYKERKAIGRLIFMTKVQFGRWVKFSMAMARRTNLAKTSMRKHKMCEEIKGIFREIQNNYSMNNILDWDGNCIKGHKSECVSDIVEGYIEGYKRWSDKLEYYFPNRFVDGIEASIRAGFDMAVRQSGGVSGFTIKDIKNMYKGNVPLWLKRKFIRFSSIKDTDHIWL